MKQAPEKSGNPATGKVFERIFSAEELAALPGGTLTLKATPAECAALARLNELPEVRSLNAVLRVTPVGRGFHVSGEVRARILQTCVVTLDDFETDVREPVDIRLVPVAARVRSKRASRDAAPAPEPIVVGTDDDPPEPMVDGKADLGSMTAEFFSLGLDPYPKKPGAAFGEAAGEGPEEAGTGDDGKESPFAALGRLRDGGKPE